MPQPQPVPIRRKSQRTAWWKNIYNRVSQSSSEHDPDPEQQDNLISPPPLPNKEARRISRGASRRPTEVDIAEVTELQEYEDPPPASTIRAYRDQQRKTRSKSRPRDDSQLTFPLPPFLPPDANHSRLANPVTSFVVTSRPPHMNAQLPLPSSDIGSQRIAGPSTIYPTNKQVPPSHSPPFDLHATSSTPYAVLDSPLLRPPEPPTPSSPGTVSDDSFLARAFPNLSSPSLANTEGHSQTAESTQSHNSRVKLGGDKRVVATGMIVSQAPTLVRPEYRSINSHEKEVVVSVPVASSSAHHLEQVSPQLLYNPGQPSLRIDIPPTPPKEKRRRSSHRRDSAIYEERSPQQSSHPPDPRLPTTSSPPQQEFSGHVMRVPGRPTTSPPKIPRVRRDQIVLPVPLAPSSAHSPSTPSSTYQRSSQNHSSIPQHSPSSDSTASEQTIRQTPRRNSAPRSSSRPSPKNTGPIPSPSSSRSPTHRGFSANHPLVTPTHKLSRSTNRPKKRYTLVDGPVYPQEQLEGQRRSSRRVSAPPREPCSSRSRGTHCVQRVSCCRHQCRCKVGA